MTKGVYRRIPADKMNKFVSDLEAWRVGSGLSLRGVSLALGFGQSYMSNIIGGSTYPSDDFWKKFTKLTKIKRADYD